jgi:hypothetical protein
MGKLSSAINPNTLKMEKQEQLKIEVEELYKGVKPEVQVIKNTYLSAGALIREMIIKKTWIVPSQRIQNV